MQVSLGDQRTDFTHVPEVDVGQYCDMSDRQPGWFTALAQEAERQSSRGLHATDREVLPRGLKPSHSAALAGGVACAMHSAWGLVKVGG